MTKEVFTIGHSNHSLDAFLALLQQHRITALADVRSHPYSRHLSHFNKSALTASLQQADIGCHRAILVCQHLRSYDLDINHILKDGQLESHQQLETRLLAAHSLDDATVNKPQQLSLFERPQKDDRPRSQRLKLAYHQQGDRIAYVEKTHE